MYVYMQQSQKMVAQQILKNNQMVAKYNKLDNQLQNVTFEYLVSYTQAPTDGCELVHAKCYGRNG